MAEDRTPMVEDTTRGLERLLPVLETVARLTPNPYDDLAVKLLRGLLESGLVGEVLTLVRNR